MAGWRRRGPRPRAPAAVAGALIVALALAAAGCTVRLRPEPAPTSGTAPPVVAATTPTAGPSVRGTTVAARAFTLVRGWPGGPARPAGPGPLPVALRRVGELDAEGVNLLLVFPLLKARPRCVRQVELWLRVLRYQPQFHIAAYPSRLVSLASDRPATRAGFETLIDNRPRGDATVTTDRAWMHFDVTELYRTWAAGGPFPSQQRTVRRGTPLVVDVRPDSFAEPYFEVRFAPLDRDADTTPQLRWTAARDC
jgi:hypothetical protein